ncbi:MarR family winged helix-turn-helix transcriptional regulator [Paenibacillus sp. FSL R7-277]|uniref:MarR family winged helix-turn-helix transcriptional regulator n=2 Tax=Paenibacillus TaxID=44249 RepID=UPI000686B25B|nr:MarR family transcriptional regulator [Paenibacillus sp. FSL R7-277]
MQLLNTRISSAFSGCTGLSASRFRLMQELLVHEEVSQSALQKSLGIDGAAVTRHLKQLELLAFVSRRNCPDDNRITLVSLNENGRQHVNHFLQANSEVVEGLFAGFATAERQALADMLERMYRNAQNL